MQATNPYISNIQISRGKN